MPRFRRGLLLICDERTPHLQRDLRPSPSFPGSDALRASAEDPERVENAGDYAGVFQPRSIVAKHPDAHRMAELEIEAEGERLRLRDARRQQGEQDPSPGHGKQPYQRPTDRHAVLSDDAGVTSSFKIDGNLSGMCYSQWSLKKCPPPQA